MREKIEMLADYIRLRLYGIKGIPFNDGRYLALYPPNVDCWCRPLTITIMHRNKKPLIVGFIGGIYRCCELGFFSTQYPNLIFLPL